MSHDEIQHNESMCHTMLVVLTYLRQYPCRLLSTCFQDIGRQDLCSRDRNTLRLYEPTCRLACSTFFRRQVFFMNIYDRICKCIFKSNKLYIIPEKNLPLHVF